jgi:hypothetical protein
MPNNIIYFEAQTGIIRDQPSRSGTARRWFHKISVPSAPVHGAHRNDVLGSKRP